MIWFKRKKEKVQPIVVQAQPQNRVEIELHKSASEEAAQKAKQTNQHLSDLILDNGFTLKVYLAAGGQVHHKRQGKK